jgi:hypothetical protein
MLYTIFVDDPFSRGNPFTMAQWGARQLSLEKPDFAGDPGLFFIL